MRYKQSLRSVRSKQKSVKHPEELDSELPIPETTEPQSQDILQLQQTYGNQAVSRLLTAPKGGPSRLQPQAVLRHQQTYGNQAVLRLLSAQKGAGSPGVI